MLGIDIVLTVFVVVMYFLFYSLFGNYLFHVFYTFRIYSVDILTIFNENNLEKKKVVPRLFWCRARRAHLKITPRRNFYKNANPLVAACANNTLTACCVSNRRRVSSIQSFAIFREAPFNKFAYRRACVKLPRST